MMDVGVVGHRRHRRLEVKVLELRLHVRVESRRQVAHSHSSNPPLRAVSLILSPSGGGRLVYRDTGTELVLNALAAGPGRLERVRCGVRAKRKQPNRAPRNALASLRPALRGSWPPEAGRLDLSRLLPSRERGSGGRSTLGRPLVGGRLRRIALALKRDLCALL